MNLHPFGHAMELLRVADAMSIRASILPKDEGKAFILSVLERFKPWKKKGILRLEMVRREWRPRSMNRHFQAP